MPLFEPKPPVCIINRSHRLASRLWAAYPVDRDGSTLGSAGGTVVGFSRDSCRFMLGNDAAGTPNLAMDMTKGTSGAHPTSGLWKSLDMGMTLEQPNVGSSELQYIEGNFHMDDGSTAFTRAITMAMWVVVGDLAAAPPGHLFHITQHDNAPGISISTSNAVELRFSTASGDRTITSSTTFDDDLPHHFVGVFGDSNYKLYADGILIGTQTTEGGYLPDDGDPPQSRFGGDKFMSNRVSFDLYDLRIWDMELPYCAISELYHDPWGMYKQ